MSCVYPSSRGSLSKPERTIVIGDVHGCFDELVQLIEQLNLTDKDLLIFLGDLLHKGPESGLVCEYVLSLAREYHVVLVWGNHEEKHMRWLRHEQTRLETGKKNPTRHVEEYPGCQEQLTDEHVAFLRGEIYPVYMYYQFPGHIVVHGGVPGCLKKLPVEQSITVAAGADQKKRMRWKLKQLYRVRYEDERGHMVSMGSEEPGHRYWAENYDGRFGTAVFGHQPFDRPAIYPHAVGIDTGCVYGNYLTAYVVDHQTGHTNLLEVEAAKVYQKRKALMNRNPAEEHNNAD